LRCCKAGYCCGNAPSRSWGTRSPTTHLCIIRDPGKALGARSWENKTDEKRWEKTDERSGERSCEKAFLQEPGGDGPLGHDGCALVVMVSAHSWAVCGARPQRGVRKLTAKHVPPLCIYTHPNPTDSNGWTQACTLCSARKKRQLTVLPGSLLRLLPLLPEPRTRTKNKETQLKHVQGGKA